ncbi:alpha/beta hydrolase [Paraherbaspirillum soli]|uniref:Alpha/beta hydrolase n=1 Tax=Paraherbaspirillum soli TaxID=631222 RepID=A0ABW0MD49_9BURK
MRSCGGLVKAKFERGDAFHYRWVPLTCLQQVDRLRDWVRERACRIGCPTLIVHARDDELTSLKSAAFLCGAIPDARAVVLENSYHLICIDNDRKTVFASMLDFFGSETAVEDCRDSWF